MKMMMKKKGMAKGGMTKKGYKNGGKVRGVGIASKDSSTLIKARIKPYSVQL